MSEGSEIGESHKEGDNMQRMQVEKSEVRDNLEEWQTNNERLSSKKANDIQNDASSGERGMQICIEKQGGSEHDEAAGAMGSVERISNLEDGEAGIAERSKSSSPPAIVRRKGYRNWGTLALFRGGLEGLKQECLKQGRWLTLQTKSHHPQFSTKTSICVIRD